MNRPGKELYGEMIAREFIIVSICSSTSGIITLRLVFTASASTGLRMRICLCWHIRIRIRKAYSHQIPHTSKKLALHIAKPYLALVTQWSVSLQPCGLPEWKP